MPSELLTDRHGAVLVLTLRDPASLNLLSRQLLAAFAEALDIAEGDPQVRCIVVHGAGANFCGGSAAQADDEPASSMTASPLQAALDQLIESLRVCPKPVLAAVEGLAAGSGLTLALGCDLMVAAADARFEFAQTCNDATADATADATLNTAVDARSTAALARLLPTPLLQQFVWLAEPMNAQRLHQQGLVGWVCETGQALEVALGIAVRLATRSADALALAKEQVQQARPQPPVAPSRPGPQQLPLGLDAADQAS